MYLLGEKSHLSLTHCPCSHCQHLCPWKELAGSAAVSSGTMYVLLSQATCSAECCLGLEEVCYLGLTLEHPCLRSPIQ